MWILCVWFWTMFLKPSESYMRRLGRKSANRWLREAHYCPILHCKSLQYSASERRRLADFWPSHLIYASDCGLKSWNFCISCRSSEFWSEIISMNIDYRCVEYFLFFSHVNLWCDRTCLNLWITTGLCMLGERFHQENSFFLCFRQLLPYGFGSSMSRLRKLLLSQELRRFAYR